MRSSWFIFIWIGLQISCVETYEQGKRIYDARCANCHMPDGKGLNQLIPSLHDVLPKYDVAPLSCVIKSGIASKDGVKPPMPAYQEISDAELCNLINYINSNFSKDKPSVTIKDVKGIVCD